MVKIFIFIFWLYELKPYKTTKTVDRQPSGEN
jgi:hypothetical protein